MGAAEHWDLVSSEQYLSDESHREIRHEYVNGTIHAMAGGSNSHSEIATNLVGLLFGALKGNGCRPFNSDTKVRLRNQSDERFYYPDAMVVCKKNPGGVTYQDYPVALFEVLSESTRRTDENEKRDAYLRISSLETYVLLEQDSAVVVVYQKNESGEFERHVINGIAESLRLKSLDITLELTDIYDGVLSPT